VHSIRLLLALVRIVSRATVNAVKRYGSESWPMVEGRIFSAAVGADELGWQAELTYSYSAETSYQSGTFMQSFFTEGRAQAFADQFPRGSAVPVRYKPGRPQVSVIRKGDLTTLSMGIMPRRS
jgi:uncharacterized protein DUF3592